MVYLDHAATTHLRPESREAWLDAAHVTANPASLHTAGRSARRIVEESRERIAAALSVPPSCVVFTSGGTESDNIAITGTVAAQRHAGRSLVVLPRSEHKAVLEPSLALGADSLRWLEVDASGKLDPAHLKTVLAEDSERVALVCLMAVNNEVGVIQPLAEAAGVCAEFGIPLHTDAVQALGVEPLELAEVTSAAFSAHKVGGPMGAGLLYVRPGSAMDPVFRGGGHESGLRAGTLDVPGIAATAVAVDLAVAEQSHHVAHLAELRDRLLRGLAGLPGTQSVVNSAPDGVPGIVNVAFPGCESDALMMLLDSAGISVSTGSACTVGIPRPSHVLLAMGRDPAGARSALRISFGRSSTADDVDAVLAALPGAVGRARRAGVLAKGVSS